MISDRPNAAPKKPLLSFSSLLLKDQIEGRLGCNSLRRLLPPGKQGEAGGGRQQPPQEPAAARLFPGVRRLRFPARRHPRPSGGRDRAVSVMERRAPDRGCVSSRAGLLRPRAESSRMYIASCRDGVPTPIPEFRRHLGGGTLRTSKGPHLLSLRLAPRAEVGEGLNSLPFWPQKTSP